MNATLLNTRGMLSGSTDAFSAKVTKDNTWVEGDFYLTVGEDRIFFNVFSMYLDQDAKDTISDCRQIAMALTAFAEHLEKTLPTEEPKD